MRKKPRSTAGFTITEVAATAAIIGILSSIAIPAYWRYALRARQSEVKTGLSRSYAGEVVAMNTFGTYVDCFTLFTGCDTVQQFNYFGNKPMCVWTGGWYSYGFDSFNTMGTLGPPSYGNPVVIAQGGDPKCFHDLGSDNNNVQNVVGLKSISPGTSIYAEWDAIWPHPANYVPNRTGFVIPGAAILKQYDWPAAWPYGNDFWYIDQTGTITHQSEGDYMGE